MLGVLGRTGSGKTTLLKMLAGIDLLHIDDPRTLGARIIDEIEHSGFGCRSGGHRRHSNDRSSPCETRYAGHVV